MSGLNRDGRVRDFVAGEWDAGDLDRALLAAHAVRDTGGLVRLYTVAADMTKRSGDVNAESFYLTHAFVFALEAGMPEARALNRRLAELGRAELLAF